MITIIVPFYNTDKYLEQCLASIRGQTFSDYECLMIDDGSTDNSRSIAQSFANADKRFKLLNKEHVGFPMAKNIGLDNAKGEYIAFLDSDDYILSKYLELLYKGLTKNNADICKCIFTRFKNQESPKITERKYEAKTHQEDKKIQCMFRSTFMWDKLYKRELFDDLRFEDMIALSDTALCYKLFEKAQRVTEINQTLVCHRDHNESMTYRVRNFEPTYWKHRANIFITMCSSLLESHPLLSKLIKSIFRSEFCCLIKSNMSEEIYNSFLEKSEVKLLLEP